MQGIIKSLNTTSKNRTTDDTMTSEEQQKKELLIGRPSPIIFHESNTTENEIDCSASIVKKASDTFQLLSLNVEAINWMEKKEVGDNENNSFEDLNVVESDVTYNKLNEIF
ncbi:hypothetical protein JD844_016654 [Phrynosoma platyrhinos]|uniref:Uncharacterized protein n=1 Tax=Phrynosoma platyrhinos TaxID=52577 RepID=A0ABQ7SKN7_PHRPL|nr:hypothetical protein JD844_016654 [Phrynosoma platyrhinos]